MNAGILSSTLTLACIECSHSQSDTALSSQPDSDPVAQLCVRCTVLQRCRNNCIPDKGAEWAQIDALVENAQSDIARLDREIFQSDQPRAELERKRVEIQRFMEHVRSLAAPVRTLPPEVLNEIFQLMVSSPGCSLSVEDPEFQDICNPNNPNGDSVWAQTLELSQVCAFWRTVVFSRPTLWASLYIDLQEVSTSNMFQLASYYLQSSGPRPLQLELSIMDEHRRMLNTHAYNLFERLLAESQRWHDVHINATDRAVSFISLEFPVQNRFTMLTDLYWKWDPDVSSPDESEEYEEHFLDLLSLSDFPELLVCNINLFSPKHLESIRMPKLTKLKLQFHFEHHPLAALIRLFPNLRECHIYRLLEKELPDSPLIDLPPHHNLRRLTLTVRPSIQRFFHSLFLTRLESLSLDTSYPSYAYVPSMLSPSTGLLRMLDRSQVNLRHLTLHNTDEQKIIQILECLPLLTTLSLKHTKKFSSALFKRLTLTSDMANLIPQLNSLDIVYQRWRDAKIAWFLRLETPALESLCDMLESRCRFLNSGVSRLDSLSLGTDLNCSPTPLSSLPSNHRLRERLQPLVDAGLSLKLIAKSSY